MERRTVLHFSSCKMAENDKSTRGKPKLCHDGHMFVKEKSNKSGTLDFWACDQRSLCRARIHTVANSFTVARHLGDHNHEGNAARIEIAKSYGEMKRRAEDSQEGTAQIIQQATATLTQAAQGQIGGKEALKKVVRRVRQQANCAPPNPDSLTTLVIPQDFQEIEVNGQTERFLLSDSGLGNEEF